jgi:hypothetical protein
MKYGIEGNCEGNLPAESNHRISDEAPAQEDQMTEQSPQLVRFAILRFS